MALFEREQARAAISVALERASSGEGSALFLVGEAGLGKTALLNDACAAAASFRLAQAACSELEESVPFGLLDRLLGPLGVPGSELGPDLAGSTEARVRRYAGILRWLREPAEPLVLAIDDLHWGDADSVELLALVCRRLGGMRVALLATARPWPSAAFEQARALVHDGFARLERLRPLSEGASAALLQERLGAGLPDAFVRAATKACAGNPFLLSEVAEAHARGEGLVTGSPANLAEHIFLPRFAGVGAPAMRWAQAASVLGSRFRIPLVQKISGQSVAEAAQAFSTLCAAGLLRASSGGEAEFVHVLFRQALYDDVSPPLRQGLHAKALQALIDEGARLAEAVPHALAAELRGDDRTVGVLVAAGREALAAGAVTKAAEHFHAAVQATGRAAEPELLLELVDACLLAGQVDRADEALTELLSRLDLSETDRVTATRFRGRVLMAQARYSEARDSFREASQLAARGHADLVAEIVLDWVFTGAVLAGPLRSRSLLRETLDVLDEAASLDERSRASIADAMNYLDCLGGDVANLDRLYSAGRAELERQRHGAPWSWDIVFGYSAIARVTERFEHAELFAKSLQRADRERGASLSYTTLAIIRADTLWRLGSLSEAQRMLEDCVEFADLVPILGVFCSVGLAHVCDEQGDRAGSAAWVERVQGALAQIGPSPYLRLWLSFMECRSLLTIGKTADAVVAADKCAEIAESSGLIEPCIVPWHGAAIEACVAAAELDRAGELIARLGEICRPLPCQAPRAVAACGAATIAWRKGELQAAEAGFEKALAHNAAVPMPLAEAETLIAYGRFLRHTGQAAKARAVLHGALEVLAPTGAARLQSIARQELAGAGGRRSRAGQPSELTPKERQVVQLAAQGLTDDKIGRALFMSSRTVGHHLSCAYRKLGVSSRRELGRVLEDVTTGGAG